jgi:phosphoribosylamine--glycine ligase
MRDARVMREIVRAGRCDGMQCARATPYTGRAVRRAHADRQERAEGHRVQCQRFGDPETQVVLPLLRGDLGELLLRTATGRLGGHVVERTGGAAVAVVLASGGYPGTFKRGHLISGMAEADALPGVHVIHAGTTRTSSGDVLTDGGRVLAVVAEATDVAAAIGQAYNGVSCLDFEGMHYRHDIGRRALER